MEPRRYVLVDGGGHLVEEMLKLKIETRCSGNLERTPGVPVPGGLFRSLADRFLYHGRVDETPQVERKLVAILAADVVGYSRLMGLDETGTLSRLKALRREFDRP